MLNASTSSTPIIGSDKAYTCNICRQTLSLPPGQIIGEKPEEHQARVAQLLSEHLGTRHEKDMAYAMLTGNGLAGLVILYHFKHNDEVIKEFIVKNAAGIRRFTGKYLGRWRISDLMIEQMIERTLPELEGMQRLTVASLLKGMRDQIDEAPEAPA